MVYWQKMRKREDFAKSMKIAYLGIDLLYPVLESLLKEGCEIQKVFTCPTDNVTEFNLKIKEIAHSRTIPCTEEKITKKDFEWLRGQGCELLVCAGYYYRIPVTDAFPMVNFHPSPLPVGRGAWPMPVIILNQMKLGGITAHKMDKNLDTGDILLQQTFPVTEQETLQSYMDKVFSFLPGMVHALVQNLPALWKAAAPQGRGEYWKCPEEMDWTITPGMEVAQADRILRAFYGYECIYDTGSKRVEMIGARAVAGNSNQAEFPVKGGYLIAERRRRL